MRINTVSPPTSVVYSSIWNFSLVHYVYEKTTRQVAGSSRSDKVFWHFQKNVRQYATDWIRIPF